MRAHTILSYFNQHGGRFEPRCLRLRASAVTINLALLLLSPDPLSAQQSPVAPRTQPTMPTRLAFDVASVKQNKMGGEAYSNFPLDNGNVYSTLSKNNASTPAGGYFTAKNQPLWRYIAFAYKLAGTQELALRFNFFAGLAPSRIPAWASGGFDTQADMFDIEARAEGNPTKDQMRLMMQSLLADRFKLVAHMESRKAPVFALVLAKPGKSGPRLQPHPATDPCSAEPSTETVSPVASIPPNLPDPTAEMPCGVIAHLPPSGPGRYKIGGRDVTLGLLASSLPTQTGMATLPRPVIDRTGLGGSFDFALEWLHEIDGAASQPGESGPLFREALKQQLGLDLESTKGQVDVLVIDHVEHPGAN